MATRSRNAIKALEGGSHGSSSWEARKSTKALDNRLLKSLRELPRTNGTRRTYGVLRTPSQARQAPAAKHKHTSSLPKTHMRYVPFHTARPIPSHPIPSTSTILHPVLCPLPVTFLSSKRRKIPVSFITIACRICLCNHIMSPASEPPAHLTLAIFSLPKTLRDSD